MFKASQDAGEPAREGKPKPGPVVIQVEHHPDEEKPKRERRPRQPRRGTVVEVEQPEEPADEDQGAKDSSWEDQEDSEATRSRTPDDEDAAAA